MSVLSLIRSDPTYFVPMSPKVVVKTLNGDDTLLQFNAFDGAHSDMNVVYCDAERAIQEIGVGNTIIEDSQGLISKDHIKSVRVELSFAKPDVIQDHVGGLTYSYNVPFIPFLAYESEVAEIRRPRNFWMEYNLSGPSTKHRATDILLLIRKSTKKVNNPDYGVGNLVVDTLKSRKWRPLNDRDIDEIWNVSADLVSQGGLVDDELNSIYYTVVNEIFTTLYDFIERMSSITGADWDIDYDPNTFADMISFRYPQSLHSGIRVKSIDLASVTDNKLQTSYIMDGFTYTYNASSDANVKTTLYTTTVIDQTSIAHQMSNQGFSDLSNKAIAQQVQIENGDRRINAFGFIMSKIGEPSSHKDRVNCDVVLDDSANRPLGQTIGTFTIPLDDIKTTPDTIFVDVGDKIKIRFLEGSNKIWIRMFQRSGIDDSDPNTDILNTIRWHHDGIFGTAKSTYSGTAIGGDYKTKETLVWTPLNTNPTFTFEVFSKINRLLSTTNQTAARRLGTKEQFIDTSGISTDPAEINRFMSFYLSRVSKPRVTTSPFKATIPNNFIFKPYQGVSFEDSLSNTFAELQVQRARIVVSALQGEKESFLGAYNQELTLGGSENALVGDCNCG